MNADGAQTTGLHRFLHNNAAAAVHCPCQQCSHQEPPYGRRAAPGIQPASGPPPGCGGDFQAPGASAVDGGGRNGRRSPQRRPVFAGPPYRRPDHLSPVYPWELNPAQWNYPLEAGPTHCPSVPGQCGCVTGTRPFNARMPHPLPHLQVKGQGFRRTVRYVCVEEQGRFTMENHHSDPHGPLLGLLLNGHCGPGPAFLAGGPEAGDLQNHQDHQDRGRPGGGSQEDSNGCAASCNGFFPTEVPQNHLKQGRRPVAYGLPPGGPPPGGGGQELQVQGLEALESRTRRDQVRDQIRQVVTDLEDVLGGLKQVHTDMKEVVEQIDRLTAGIDLGEEASCVTRGSSNNIQRPAAAGDSRLAPLPNHRPAPFEVPQHVDKDCIILRTNSPSPVHMASVVKTRGFTPPSLIRDVSHDRPGANGHPPHLYALRDSTHVGLTQPEPRPHTLDPKVIIGNSTSNPRTLKPPPYPQNGRCGRGSFPPQKSERRTAAGAGRGRQSSSAV